MADKKETKFETRLRELDAKINLPAREAVLRAALVDVIAKQKAEEERQAAEKLVIEAAEKVVEEAEAALEGKLSEEPEEPEVPAEEPVA